MQLWSLALWPCLISFPMGVHVPCGRMLFLQVVFSNTLPNIGLMTGFWARGGIEKSLSFLPSLLSLCFSLSSSSSSSSFLSLFLSFSLSLSLSLSPFHIYLPCTYLGQVLYAGPWRMERWSGQGLSCYQRDYRQIWKISWVSIEFFFQTWSKRRHNE